MKDHTSHDVLLLCPKCHQRSNMADLSLRNKLAYECDAPLISKATGNKFIDVPRLRWEITIYAFLPTCRPHKEKYFLSVNWSRSHVLYSQLISKYLNVVWMSWENDWKYYAQMSKNSLKYFWNQTLTLRQRKS